MAVCFNQFDHNIIEKAAQNAEDLLCRHFGLKDSFNKYLQYKYRTLSDLKNHEIIDHGFAHLVKYRIKPHNFSINSHSSDLYYICLQDHRILDVVHNREDGIKLKPLMLYIMTHELIHVLRFSKFNKDFDASSSEREKEEKSVHTITYEILRKLGDSGVNCVLGHYNPFRNPRAS